MTRQYPDNDPNRLENLAFGLFGAFKALAEKENFSPDQVISAISTAAAAYAESNGISAERYFELQVAFIKKREREKKGAKE